LWKELNDLEIIGDSRVLTEEEKLDMERIRGELEKTSLLEEICWKQKPRVLCIREGDKNTKIFHCIANSYRRFNSIDRLMVDGELSSNSEAIAKCISRFYKQLYSEFVIHIPNVLGLAFSLLINFFIIYKKCSFV